MHKVRYIICKGKGGRGRKGKGKAQAGRCGIRHKGKGRRKACAGMQGQVVCRHVRHKYKKGKKAQGVGGKGEERRENGMVRGRRIRREECEAGGEGEEEEAGRFQTRLGEAGMPQREISVRLRSQAFS